MTVSASLNIAHIRMHGQQFGPSSSEELMHQFPNPILEPSSLLLRSKASDGSHIVLKRLRDDCADRADLLMRLQNEAAVLTHLTNTPGVIRLLGVETDPFTIVLEFADGGSLADMLAAGIAKEVGNDVAKRLVAAVRAIHSRGVVHRDIKPSNILFVNGELRLADFGVAAWGNPRRAVPDGWEEDVVGTAPWSAPELRVNASGHLAESVDIFGVAATLTAILGGPHGPLGAALDDNPSRRPTLEEIDRSLV